MPKLVTPRLCSIDGCAEKHHARGLCHRHYVAQLNREKHPPQPPAPPAECSIDYCPNLAVTAGLCTKHYTNLSRHGTFEAPLPRTNRGSGNTTDPVEFIRPRMTVTDLGCWQINNWTSRYGYAQVTYLGQRWQVHRWAWVHLAELPLPPYPENELDHICVNPACFRPCHLQIVDAQRNSDLKYERQAMLDAAEPGSVLAGPNKPRTLHEFAATVRLSPELIGFPPGAGVIRR